MLSFYAVAFAIAGAVAAAGPVIIHLLNRRRFRVVDWAAMDFLREAIQRNRKILQLRDLLLLALRTACVLLFGLAMARPYLSQSSARDDANQPVHAVLLVDNSLSMGAERLGGTLLAEVKQKATNYIERLPAGSRISVLPLCGSINDYSRDAYRTKEDALEALKGIEVVDRSASVAGALDLATEACQRSPDLPAKRVVLISDQQVGNWPAEGLSQQLQQLPELQVVQVLPETRDNTWVADFRLQDDIADIETSTSFIASIRHLGQNARNAVQVALLIDGVTVATQTIDLESEQTREIQFPYRFNVPAEPGRPVFVAAEVRIADDPQDRLPGDNSRFLVVPVLAALPVLFVDQYGPQEDPGKNQYGETFRLRRLLAPLQSRAEEGRQLIQVRHAKSEDFDQIQTHLADARLVVLAGVEHPDPPLVNLLREYCLQGGQLVICAGAGFDPAAWNQTAWLDGAGILPLPLAPVAAGQMPEDAVANLSSNGGEGAAAFRTWRLDPTSMVHDYFLVDDPNRDDLYRDPYFFKVVTPQDDAQILENLLQAETARIAADRKFMAEHETRRQRWATLEGQGALTGDDLAERQADARKLESMHPAWLKWHNPRQTDLSQLSEADAARLQQPQVLARLDNNQPMLLERNVGLGRVLFFASGVHSNWNTLTKTNTVLMFDRILRSLLETTLPQRNYLSDERILVPIDAADRRARLTLSRPNAPAEPLAVEALGPDLYGISLRHAMQRGVYRITAYREPTPADLVANTNGTQNGLGVKQRELVLAVNGPQDESELALISESELKDRLGAVNYQWVPAGEEISLEGARIRGQDWWKWLMALVFLGLLAEVVILMWPTLSAWKNRVEQTSDVEVKEQPA